MRPGAETTPPASSSTPAKVGVGQVATSGAGLDLVVRRAEAEATLPFAQEAWSPAELDGRACSTPRPG